MSKASDAHSVSLQSPSTCDLHDGKLFEGEHFWASLQPFLLQRGYRLRPRYEPDWVPSWKGESVPPRRLDAYEDAILPKKPELLDAIRIVDGCTVVMKKLETASEELPIGRYLSSEPLSSDPRNNTVQILDVLLLPDNDEFALIVMPMLFPNHALPFRQVSEFAVAVRQYLQGLEFMHQHNIAHRDPCYFNLMVDATSLLPQGFHFLRPTTYDGITNWTEWRERSSCENLRYYFIDFGISRRYSTNINVRDIGILAQDKTFPERSLTVPYDPFKTDIYLLGNAILDLAKDYDGLKYFRNLGKQMTRRDPQQRASLSEMLKKVDQLNKRQLKRRLWHKDIPWWLRPFFLYYKIDPQV